MNTSNPSSHDTVDDGGFYIVVPSQIKLINPILYVRLIQYQIKTIH